MHEWRACIHEIKSQEKEELRVHARLSDHPQQFEVPADDFVGRAARHNRVIHRIERGDELLVLIPATALEGVKEDRHLAHTRTVHGSGQLPLCKGLECWNAERGLLCVC